MAIFRGNKIRGEQIQDRTVRGINVFQGTLSDEHIASGASINETKLNINWHAHTEILQDKKVVDFVQANGIQASGTEIADLETQIPAITGIAQATSAGATEGIIVDSPKNMVPVRDAVTGDPLVADIGGVDYEVIARMKYDATNSKYVVRFYTASGAAGAEVAYDLGTTPVTVDMQYARRFNLATISEMFAANEKFVHGAADVTAHLNLEQVAKDIYGSSWTLDRDGSANLATSIVDQLAAEVTRAQLAESGLTTALNTEITNRTNADSTLQGYIDTLNGNATVTNSVDYKIKTQVTDPLASTAGAGSIGIVSITGLTATTVQGALEQLKVNAGDALVTYKAAVASTATGEGASLVGVDATAGLNGSTVEAVLEDHEKRLDVLEGNNTVVGSVNNKIKVQVLDPLASTATGSGAALVAVDSTSRLNAATVQGVLADHETRIDTIEANLSGANDRAATTNAYFAAATFASLDERFESDEQIVDTNLKRIDDRDKADRTRVAASANNFFAAGEKATIDARFLEVEAEVDVKSKEVVTARGSKTSLNERMSVATRADGFLVDDHKLHVHKKYTITLSVNKTQVMLPAEEFFNINNHTGSGAVISDAVQVYINGILQANGINFTEIADAVDATKGIGADFGTEELVAGDVVIFDWVLNNHNVA